MKGLPGPPAGPSSPAPPRNPAPLPRPVPPPTPRPSRAMLRFGLALIAVGVLLLVAHYFVPVLLLAGLDTKAWRAAA